MIPVNRNRRAISKFKKDKTRCVCCAQSKTKCSPSVYDFSIGEKCDRCRDKNLACSVRRSTKDHEEHERGLEAQQQRLSTCELATGPAIANRNDIGYQSRSAPELGPVNTTQREPLLASQPNLASRVSNDQYGISANVQASAVDTRAKSPGLVENEYCSPLAPKYEQRGPKKIRLESYSAEMYGCNGLLSYFKSRSEVATSLRPSEMCQEHRASMESSIQSVERLIRVQYRNAAENLSRILSAPESELPVSFPPDAWKPLLQSSHGLLEYGSGAHHADSFVATNEEGMILDLVSRLRKNGNQSLANRICLDLVIPSHAAPVHASRTQKISSVHAAYSNRGRRMMQVWSEMPELSETLSLIDGPEDESMTHVFSEMILITMDKRAWSEVQPFPAVDEKIRDVLKRTLLHLACEDPEFASFKSFDLCTKEFIEARDEYMMTAAHVASVSGNVAGIKYLRSLRADMTALDLYGRNPIMLASIKGHEEVIELLLSYDCYIDAVSIKQPRALVHAIRAGQLSTVYLLLQKGAALYCNEEHPMEMIQEAERHGQGAIVDMIRGRSVSLQEKANASPVAEFSSTDHQMRTFAMNYHIDAATIQNPDTSQSTFCVQNDAIQGIAGNTAPNNLPIWPELQQSFRGGAPIFMQDLTLDHIQHTAFEWNHST